MSGYDHALGGVHRSSAPRRPVPRAEEKAGTQEAERERPAEEQGRLLVGDVFYFFKQLGYVARTEKAGDPLDLLSRRVGIGGNTRRLVLRAKFLAGLPHGLSQASQAPGGPLLLLFEARGRLLLHLAGDSASGLFSLVDNLAGFRLHLIGDLLGSSLWAGRICARPRCARRTPRVRSFGWRGISA